jgi:hypothetical protein
MEAVEEASSSEQHEERKIGAILGARQIELTKAQLVQTSYTNVSN